jgi:hypothetical protein
MKTLPQPWSAAMEATMFTGWIYDHLKPHAAALKVAHPMMLRAIAAAKKKNDRIDDNKICDCLRCDFLPECYMAPTAIRERRRTLRYRNLLDTATDAFRASGRHHPYAAACSCLYYCWNIGSEARRLATSNLRSCRVSLS